MAKKEYMQNQETMKGIEDRIAKVVAEEKKRIAAENPEFAKEFTIVTESKCYKKRPPGFSKISPRIVQILLYRNGLDMKQVDILKMIKDEFPTHNITATIWQRNLPPYEKKAIIAQINGNMSDPVDIKKCKTLAEIKKVLKAARKTTEAERKAKLVVAINKDFVVIGKSTYPITNRKSGKYEYRSIRVPDQGKRVWLKVSTLEALFWGNDNE